MKTGTLVVLAALLFATDALPQRAGQSMSVQTGVVVAAQAVNMQSAAGSGAAIGGVVGFATTSSRRGSSRRARNTILGAAAGGAIASRAQGDLNGMQYTVEVGPGSQITVVTDQTEVKVGDCVNVEQAGSGTANVRRVSPAYCDAAFDNAVDKDISAEYGRLADMCLEAKERMMETETDEALDKAIRRVKILCND